MKSISAFNNSSIDQNAEFKILAEGITDFFTDHGLKTRPYGDPSLKHFSKLSPERKDHSLYRLRAFYRSLEATILAGEKISNNSQALWHALKTLNVIPDSDIFSKFQNEDVIEYYDVTGTQIWRNFNYMKICSYTFEELTCHDWPTLYVRDQKLNESLVALMIDTVNTGHRGPKFIDVDYHVCDERFSEDRYRLHVRHDYICPLFDTSQQAAGFIVTSKVKVVGTAAPEITPETAKSPELRLL
jgi:hypothetical protein